MAFEWNYSPEIKAAIRQAIVSYLENLHYQSSVELEQKQEGLLRHLDATADLKELRTLHGYYRDHLAEGFVYFVLYKNGKHLYFSFGIVEGEYSKLNRTLFISSLQLESSL